MPRCHLFLCLWAILLWVVAEGRPSSMEQLPDGTDEMLSSMGLVETLDQLHELDHVPRPIWQQSAGQLVRLSDSPDTVRMELEIWGEALGKQLSCRGYSGVNIELKRNERVMPLCAATRFQESDRDGRC